MHMDAHGDTFGRPDRGLLGRWVLAAITELGLGSPTALAKKSGVSRPTVKVIVSGDPEATVTMTKWQDVARRGFGFAPDTFVQVALGEWQSLASRKVPPELVEHLQTLLADRDNPPPPPVHSAGPTRNTRAV